MKHKHAELIHAWADGAEIQIKMPSGEWVVTTYPSWDGHREYRIKPEEKKPVVRWLWAATNTVCSGGFYTEEDAIKNGYSIKLEWSRTEFPE